MSAIWRWCTILQQGCGHQTVMRSARCLKMHTQHDEPYLLLSQATLRFPAIYSIPRLPP